MSWCATWWATSLASVEREITQVLDPPTVTRRSRNVRDATSETARSLERQIEALYRRCGSALQVASDLGVSKHLVSRVTARSCPEMVEASLKARVKPFVPMVHELIGDGLNLSEVSRRTGLAWSSVAKIAALMPDLREHGQKVLHEKRRHKYRASMIALSEEGATREQIWRDLPGGTRWLLMHDREWLAARWPTSIDALSRMISKAGAWSDVYWSNKDKEFSVRISSTVQALVDRQLGPLQRITPTMIFRELGWSRYPSCGPAGLAKRMPETAFAIAIHSESRMAFQCRRLVRLLNEQWRDRDPLPRKWLSKRLSVRPEDLNGYLWLVGFRTEHLRTPSRIRHKRPSEVEFFSH